MLKISFTDFWPGFQEKNNLITNILKEIFDEEIKITIPRQADVCFFTIFGKNHKRIIRKFREKSIREDFSLQKLVNRSIDLFVYDEDFAKKVMEYENLEESGSKY